MSDNDKDNNNFEFIKEQVIEKKHKKVKKWLLPPVMTAGMAILFGIVAAGTFVIVEPRMQKLMHKEEETKTTVCFPTEIPANNTGTPSSSPASASVTPSPKPVIVKQSIDADLSDYLAMNNEMRKISYEAQKSLLNITSTVAVKDWFGKSETTVNTTGVIIYNNTKDLLVLVSLDRVKDAKSIKIVFSETVSVDAVIQASDKDTNLGIISVPVEDIPEPYLNGLQPAMLGESYSIMVGDPVIALGSPNGHSNSMEIGSITSKDSYAAITDNRLGLFNTSITDNVNSDGIIINLDGKIIGIITRTLKEDVNKDLNTVIGISDLKPIITAMCNQTPRVYFGVRTDDMTSATMKEYEVDSGIYVNDVQADSPAFKAGIQNGDIILTVDGVSVLDSSNFYDIISKHKPGSTAKIKIKRANSSKNNEIELNVELATKGK